MPSTNTEAGNLWLARALWELGAVRFGDFTLGRTTVHSPIYVNPRRLISRPTALRRAAREMASEIETDAGRRNPHFAPFQRVAGVPIGGLLLGTAFSLITRKPMIYAHTANAVRPGSPTVEGAYEPNERVLLIDDLITTGGSVLEAAELLRNEGLEVRNAIVLIDRGEGAAHRLRQAGIGLTSMLTLETMLNYYLSTGRIDEHLHRKCLDFIAAKRTEFSAE